MGVCQEPSSGCRTWQFFVVCLFLLLGCGLLLCFLIVGFSSVNLSKDFVCLDFEPGSGLTFDLAQGPSGVHLSPQPFLSVDWPQGSAHTVMASSKASRGILFSL